MGVSPPTGTDVRLRWRWLAVLAFAGGCGWAGWQAWADPVPRLRHPAVITTAYVSFALWAGAVGLMLQAKPGEWAAGAVRFRVTQWTWVLAATTFLIHVAVAFHFAHRWSHANAIRHVEETAGFGPGLFVSYLFTLVWAADAGWLAVAPAGYARRPPWLGWAGQGFLAFVTFNGTVVYGHGLMRWVSGGVFVVLGWYLVTSRRRSAAAPLL